MSNAQRKVLLTREQKNEKYRHISLEMETSTHFPLLIGAVQWTRGEVLEVGSGVFSTPLLHWLLSGTGRRLTTVERHLHYLDFARKFRAPWHEVVAVKDIASSDLVKRRYSVVFIDHTPKKPTTRGDDALLFKDTADMVILHDAGDHAHAKYGYAKVYPEFKYRHDWTGNKVQTTVLSNVIDVSDTSLWPKT